MDLATNIRKYREMRGYTLPDLAQRAGVSKAFVWEIENGNSKRPGAETLFKIAEALDVTIAHLMGKEPAGGGQGAAGPSPPAAAGLRRRHGQRAPGGPRCAGRAAVREHPGRRAGRRPSGR